MPEITYGYICGMKEKGQSVTPGVIVPLLSIAQGTAENYFATIRGEAYVWINWITEFEGVGLVTLQRLWKCKNGVVTLMFDTDAWGDASPFD